MSLGAGKTWARFNAARHHTRRGVLECIPLRESLPLSPPGHTPVTHMPNHSIAFFNAGLSYSEGYLMLQSGYASDDRLVGNLFLPSLSIGLLEQDLWDFTTSFLCFLCLHSNYSNNLLDTPWSQWTTPYSHISAVRLSCVSVHLGKHGYV